MRARVAAPRAERARRSRRRTRTRARAATGTTSSASASGPRPFEPRMQEVIVAGIAEAIRTGARGGRPGRAGRGAPPAEQLVRNRAGGAEEGRLMVVRLTRPGGEPVAELVVFAAHPTTLGKRNRLHLRRLARPLPPRAATAASGCSSRAPRRSVGEAARRRADDARDLRRRALARGGRAPARDDRRSPGLSFASADVVLPAPSPPGALPPLLRPAARNLAYGVAPRPRRASSRSGSARRCSRSCRRSRSPTSPTRGAPTPAPRWRSSRSREATSATSRRPT